MGNVQIAFDPSPTLKQALVATADCYRLHSISSKFGILCYIFGHLNPP